MTDAATAVIEGLPEATPLCSLVIPGSHDTMTSACTHPYYRTQALSLSEQLDVGVRYLDLRLTRTMVAAHREWVSGTTAERILDVLRSHLVEHPRDFLLVRIQNANEAKDDFERYGEALRAVISENLDLFWRPTGTPGGTVWPTIGRIRGLRVRATPVRPHEDLRAAVGRSVAWQRRHPPPGRLGRPGRRGEARGGPEAPHGCEPSGVAGAQPCQRDQRGPGESRRVRRRAQPGRSRDAALRRRRQGRAHLRLRGRGARGCGMGRQRRENRLRRGRPVALRGCRCRPAPAAGAVVVARWRPRSVQAVARRTTRVSTSRRRGADRSPLARAIARSRARRATSRG